MKRLCALIVIVLISGCVRPATPFPASSSENPRWSFTTEQSPKGVFLVVHGLNLRPSALDPMCGFLASLGYHSYRMTLHGHNEASNGTFEVAMWQSNVADAYSEVQRRFPKLPVYVLGYSIGGLLLADMVGSGSQPHRPQGMILLAPAISLHTIFTISSALNIPPALSWSVPNVAPEEYRRYDLTPLFWYFNTLTLNASMRTPRNPTQLKSIPTLVLLNPEDELVSLSGTTDWIEENKLSPEWRIEVIRPEAPERNFKQHLIIDEASLGKRGWTRLRSIVEGFLRDVAT